MNQATWSPDGTRIATASADGTAKLWAADGTLQTTLQGHTGAVNQAIWSPDSTRIATVSDDQTAKVWAADGTLQTITLQGHTDRVNKGVWAPDGTRMLTISQDGTFRQWFLRADHMLAVAKCQVARGPTIDEIKQYNIPIPLLFDFGTRQCPPILSKP